MKNELVDNRALQNWRCYRPSQRLILW